MASKRFFMLPLFVLALPMMASAQGAEELIDPTRPVAFAAPVGKKTQEENKLQLQAIFFGESRREAVINGKTVKVGDVVDQAKILVIGPGRVRFEKNGEKGELVLLPTVSKPVRVEE
jgi:MSHA biogenesis protein MshK